MSLVIIKYVTIGFNILNPSQLTSGDTKIWVGIGDKVVELITSENIGGYLMNGKIVRTITSTYNGSSGFNQNIDFDFDYVILCTAVPFITDSTEYTMVYIPLSKGKNSMVLNNKLNIMNINITNSNINITGSSGGGTSVLIFSFYKY